MAVSESTEHSEGARALDFSQPTRFNPELTHRLTGAMGAFCDALSGRLAGELKTEVQLSVGEVSQHTWAAANAQLPVDSVSVPLTLGASEHPALLSLERTLLMQALECLLGGSAAQAPPGRHLSEIDWALAGSLLDAIVAELSLALSDVGAPPLERGEADMEGDGGVLTPPSEPTFTVSLTSVLDGESSSLSLLLPWVAVGPFAEQILQHGAGSTRNAAEGSAALVRGLSGAQVLLRAEVGSLEMPIAGLLELAPGAVLALGESAEEGVRLFAEDISIGRGRPGASGTRRAIKLEATGEAPKRAATYATLGRAELQRARAHAQGDSDAAGTGAVLRSIFVRIWAELGRTHMALGQALELAPGAVLELDQGAQAPVELFANGLCFANGSLMLTPEGEWGVLIGELVDP